GRPAATRPRRPTTAFRAPAPSRKSRPGRSRSSNNGTRAARAAARAPAARHAGALFPGSARWFPEPAGILASAPRGRFRAPQARPERRGEHESSEFSRTAVTQPTGGARNIAGDLTTISRLITTDSEG